ncbi:MAG: hypothetical protein NC218_08990 [Acetobacter sp.]|nr:hypothetical protein [Acetobacter sp.]
MNILQLLFYKDLPKDFLYTYGEYIHKQKRLRNGWLTAKIANGFTFFLHPQYVHFSVPAVMKITEAEDGKFMLKIRGGKKIIYAADGRQLTPFDKHTHLYPNGWYQYMENDTLSLYNNKEECICSKLRYSRVYKNGMYLANIATGGDARLAGLFSAEGQKLLFTNSKKVTILPNGWFVSDHTLYDNLGNVYLEPIPQRKIPNWMLCLAGLLMRQKTL